jgi:hypothetical protein
MATPTSPLEFSDIYSEANGVDPVSPVSFSVLTSNTYFAGPNGANTQNFNSWGGGSGIDGIYSVANNGQATDRFSPYRNVSYYYDQSQYQVTLEVINNSGNDFNITMYYMDSSLVYNYLVMNTGPVFGSSTFGPTDLSTNMTPLIYGCNWKLQIDQSPFYGGGNDVRMTINGATLLNTLPISPTFPAPEFWDYQTYGNETMLENFPTGATGSVIEIRIA